MSLLVRELLLLSKIYDLGLGARTARAEVVTGILMTHVGEDVIVDGSSDADLEILALLAAGGSRTAAVRQLEQSQWLRQSQVNTLLLRVVKLAAGPV